MGMHGTTRCSERHLTIALSNVHLSKTRLKKLPNSSRTSPFLLTPAAYAATDKILPHAVDQRFLDTDAYRHIVTSETSDLLAKAVRSLAGHYVRRCVLIAQCTA